MTTPAARYQQKIASSAIQANSAQYKVVNALESLYTQIIAGSQHYSKIFALLGLSKPIKGIYLWGGVGRGKTFLVDLLYDCLPPETALRIHFHRFMLRVHELLTKFQGQVDPLEDVADDFMRYKVLIFDEFYVADITDAMLLGLLLQKLFAKGMVLVATSNTPPQLLYLNGLQRAKFLPAIAAIKKYCQVICLDSGIDFRMRILATMDIFHYPITPQTEQLLEQYFHKLAPNLAFSAQHTLMINDRAIPNKMYADSLVWFDFADLCEGPRSANDYIQIAKLYRTIFLSNVPVFSEHNQDSARRFIELIDELYDRKVKLIMSCACDVQDLFVGGINALAFERTQSRLIEMQSQEYMQLPYLK